MSPGQIALTLTPVPVSPWAAVCARLMTPALLAGVGAAAGAGAKPGDGSGQHDGAAAPSGHDGGRVLDRQKRADQVYAQHLGPKLRRLLQEWGEAAADPCVGVDDVEAAKRLLRQGDISANLGLVADVGGMGEHSSARLADPQRRLAKPDSLAIDRHHHGAFARERERARASDAAGRPRDDRDFSLESTHFAFLSRPRL